MSVFQTQLAVDVGGCDGRIDENIFISIECERLGARPQHGVVNVNIAGADTGPASTLYD